MSADIGSHRAPAQGQTRCDAENVIEKIVTRVFSLENRYFPSKTMIFDENHVFLPVACLTSETAWHMLFRSEFPL